MLTRRFHVDPGTLIPDTTGRARLVCESSTVPALRDDPSDRTAFKICVRLDDRVVLLEVSAKFDLESLTERMIADGNALTLCPRVDLLANGKVCK